jgi:hypothetical protein
VVCGKPDCQRRRRTDYHRKKIAMDPEYHQVTLESQKLWREEHPDYQKQRRQQSPQLVENNRERQRQRDQKRRLRRRLLPLPDLLRVHLQSAAEYEEAERLGERKISADGPHSAILPGSR